MIPEVKLSLFCKPPKRQLMRGASSFTVKGEKEGDSFCPRPQRREGFEPLR